MQKQGLRAPRCDAHPPFSALLRCNQCKAMLCRMCIKTFNGEELCGACGGSCSKLDAGELHTAAEHQSRMYKRSDIPSAPPPPAKTAPAPAPPTSVVAAAPGDAAPQTKMLSRMRGRPLGAPLPSEAANAAGPDAASATASATATAEQPVIVPTFGKRPPYFCKNHKTVKATRVCDVCHEEYCGPCAKMIEQNPRCPECGAQLQKLPPDEQGFSKVPMWTRISSAFMFPLVGDGKLILALGTILLWGSGYGGWKARGAVLAFMYAYLMKTCKNSAIGRETPPGWPGSEDYFGITHFFFAKLFSIAPAILYIVLFSGVGLFEFMAGDAGEDPYETSSYQEYDEEEINIDDPLADPGAQPARPRGRLAAKASRVTDFDIIGPLAPFFILSFIGGVYLPMAILAACLFRTFQVLNPLFVFGAIAKVKDDYIPIYILLLIAEVIAAVGGAVMSELPLVGQIAGRGVLEFIWLYLMMIQMHVLGEMYCLNRNRLGWFTKKAEETAPAAA